MKRISLIIAIMTLFFAPALAGQSRSISPLLPVAEKILITGGVYVFEGSGYGSVTVWVNLTYNGNPMSGTILRLNEHLIDEKKNGMLYKLIEWWIPKMGEDLVFSVQAKPTPQMLKPPRITLAAYKVANVIVPVFPKDKTVINLLAYPQGLPLRWHFTGHPAMCWVRVRERINEGFLIPYEKKMAGEEAIVPIATLNAGKKYSMGVENAEGDPLGRFQFTANAAPHSKVDFYYRLGVEFSTLMITQQKIH